MIKAFEEPNLNEKLEKATKMLAKKEYAEAKKLLKECYKISDNGNLVNVSLSISDAIYFNTLCNILFLEGVEIWERLSSEEKMKKVGTMDY